MKKYTYPILENEQAKSYRNIFNRDNTNIGRVKGINNSVNLVELFPESPAYVKTNNHSIDDRGKLLSKDSYTSLTDDDISTMFARVIDGYKVGDFQNTHVSKLGPAADGSNFTDDKNYNWLYRDQAIDMNFRYLKASSPNSNDFIPSSPNAVDNKLVGTNNPIDNESLYDKPFWGHPNLQVPSVNPELSADVARVSHDGVAQLKRGSGGFGTSYSLANKNFAAQEKIGSYFTNSYLALTNIDDRMDNFAGQSMEDRGIPSSNAPEGTEDTTIFTKQV